MTTLAVDDVTQKMTFNGGSAKTGGWFTTFSGKKFNPINPNPEDICIQDIAQSLSNSCRFGGHVIKFYSVAQHSVHCSYLCDPEDAFAALMHDAAEAYIGDMVRPLKYTDAMLPFREIEHNIEKVISTKFNIPDPMPPSVKIADDILVVAEAIKLFTPTPQWALDTLEKRPHEFQLTEMWDPYMAKSRFMMRYYELIGAITVTNKGNLNKVIFNPYA